MPAPRLRTWFLSLTAITSLGAVAALAAQTQPLSFDQWWNRRPAPLPAAAAVATGRAEGRRGGDQPADTLHRLRHWTTVAVDASGLDHTPSTIGAPHTFGHQLGPGRASRAMAIVHIAMFEVVNAIDRRYESYLGLPVADQRVSMDAAIAQVAHDTLNELFPSQGDQCDRLLDEDLRLVPAGPDKQAGIRLGKTVAAAILRKASSDGSAHAEPLYGVDYVAGSGPGEWRQDPISQLPVALGARWGEVRPFVIPSGQAFRVPAPPALDSPAYAAAFKEVQRVGGDDQTTPSFRTPDQTLAALYWAYDGTPSLCAPPRLYNQLAMQIADQMGSDVVDQARLLALMNVAMSDAGIAAWESKFHYRVWRPVAGIRESDPGTGPSGAGDGNAATKGDPTFRPLGAPASNNTTPDFTPPFPAYPSGHATFGGAVFQTLRNVYQRDDIAFTFVSDELNGVTVDSQGRVRPLVPRSFATLSQAEEENGQSRIYLGIHWSFDKTAGIAQGRAIADHVFQNAFRPVS
jgi:hypothetical protein